MTTPTSGTKPQTGSGVISGCAPPGEPNSHRILIIDDAPAIHDDFRKILNKVETPALDQARAALFGSPTAPSERVNFVLDSAYQGQEGLALVERALTDGQPYALAFVDIRMPPGWDGIETISRLWAADPDLQVVICTAYSDYSWDQVIERLGRTDSLLILKKPFDGVEVLQLAHALTRKWLLTRQAKSRLADLDRMVNERTQDLRALNDRLLLEMAERKQAQVRLSAFSALGQHLSAAPTAKAAGQVIVDTADQLLGWDACLLDLYSPAENILCQVLYADIIDGRRTECPPRMTATRRSALPCASSMKGAS
jgi:CheY-like chemotaxis protein